MNENKLNIVELFSGPGGLGLGFHLEGFKTIAAYEYEDDCIDTYSANFPEAEVIKKDLSQFTDEDMTELKNMVFAKTGREDVDIVVGGPPCRSFSSANPKKRDGDPRDTLYRPLIKVASELNAKYFVMENVADINNKISSDIHERKILHVIFDELYQEGFKYINCNLLNAADYGTPQTRERLIVIATKDENLPVTFPDPLYFPRQEPKWLTVEEAFQDLPKVTAPKDTIRGEQQELLKHEGKMFLCHEYGDSPRNDFTRFCRGELTEFGYVQKKLIEGTVNRLTNFLVPNHTERIIERYSLLKRDESQGLLRDRLERELLSEELEELLRRKVISAGTFRQKNRRLPLELPSRTVTSHVREELVHPTYNRNLTAREAARLQGFPDWYILKGINQKPYKGSSEDIGNGRDFYQQVGDAVPPLLSAALAFELKKNILQESQPANFKKERELLINWVIKEGITLHEIKRREIAPSVTIGEALSGTVEFDLEFMIPLTLV